MSDKEVQAVHVIAAKKEQHFHNLAQSGELNNAGGPTRTHDQSENNPNSKKSKRKKRLRDEFLEATLRLVRDAHNKLLEEINQQLEEIQKQLREIENQMRDNRIQWESNGQTLNDIDDIFTDFKNGGELNHSKAFTILSVSDCVPEGFNALSDAQIIEHLENLRIRMLADNEYLEIQFGQLEGSQKIFKAHEIELLKAKKQLAEITSNHALNSDQKLDEIQNLSNEISTKTLHKLATQSSDEGVKQMVDEVFSKDRNSVNQSFVVKPVF